MAAVMIRALEPRPHREAVASAVEQGDWRSAAKLLGAEMESLWRNGESVPHPPVAGFGIDRQGEFFHSVVARDQEVFFERELIDWPFARHELAAPRETLRGVFAELRRLGFILGICTSRDRVEVDPPMTELGIFDCFDPAHIVTHDETMEAQRISGIRPLQKPHWFPLVCAMVGFDSALKALQDSSVLARLPRDGQRIFVGDTTADFGAARAAVGMGFPVDYLHIDSRVTSAATLAEICRHEITLGMASDLASALPLLAGGSQ
jgi:phosphoglycolate phosphatase-like HAD superfamily hydrolase